MEKNGIGFLEEDGPALKRLWAKRVAPEINPRRDLQLPEIYRRRDLQPPEKYPRRDFTNLSKHKIWAIDARTFINSNYYLFFLPEIFDAIRVFSPRTRHTFKQKRLPRSVVFFFFSPTNKYNDTIPRTLHDRRLPTTTLGCDCV